MLPRLMRQDDEEEWEVEQWYGKPQHETDSSISEQELYGDPQHDVPNDRFPSEFDPDFGYPMNWLDFPQVADDDSERPLLSATGR